MFALSSLQAFAFAPGSAQVLAAGTWLRLRRQSPDTVMYLERGRVLLGIGQGGQMRHQLGVVRSEEHTSELQSHLNLVCRLLLEKKKKRNTSIRVTCLIICNRMTKTQASS